jgi:hypothetical protein
MQWRLTFQLAFALLIMMVEVNSIMFKLVSNAATCLKIAGDNTYVIDYVVSGENDRGVKM